MNVPARKHNGMPFIDRLRRGATAFALIASLVASTCACAQIDDDEDEPAPPLPEVTAETSRVGSDKLLLTGGVSQLEGAAGGGLTPWAVIGGYGTRDQIGANAFITHLGLPDYTFNAAGALVAMFDRFEIEAAEERFDTQNVGAALGIGRGFVFRQDIFGLKLKLFGDAVLEQDSWLPQVSAGLQYKKNNQGDVLAAIGAKSDHGIDFYLTATKLYLGESILVNGTLRFTKANQIGLLGFGGDKNNRYEPELEGSVAYLLSRTFAVGVEYRMKPNNLGIAQEDDWYDAFVAWAPTKNISLTLAYAYLGNIVIKDNQRGLYLSAQIGF